MTRPGGRAQPRGVLNTFALLFAILALAGAAQARSSLNSTSTSAAAMPEAGASPTRALMRATNRLRTEHQMDSLRLHAGLQSVAQAQANHMCQTGYLSHNAPGGTLMSRLASAGFHAVRAADNIAKSQTSDGAAVAQQWLRHAHHRAVVLGDFVFTGVGNCKDARGQYFWVQIFGKEIPNAQIPHADHFNSLAHYLKGGYSGIESDKFVVLFKKPKNGKTSPEEDNKNGMSDKAFPDDSSESASKNSGAHAMPSKNSRKRPSSSNRGRSQPNSPSSNSEPPNSNINPHSSMPAPTPRVVTVTDTIFKTVPKGHTSKPGTAPSAAPIKPASGKRSPLRSKGHKRKHRQAPKNTKNSKTNSRKPSKSNDSTENTSSHNASTSKSSSADNDSSHSEYPSTSSTDSHSQNSPDKDNTQLLLNEIRAEVIQGIREALKEAAQPLSNSSTEKPASKEQDDSTDGLVKKNSADEASQEGAPATPSKKKKASKKNMNRSASSRSRKRKSQRNKKPPRPARREASMSIEPSQTTELAPEETQPAKNRAGKASRTGKSPKGMKRLSENDRKSSPQKDGSNESADNLVSTVRDMLERLFSEGGYSVSPANRDSESTGIDTSSSADM